MTDNAPTQEIPEEEKENLILEILKRNVKSKSLIEEAFSYMSKLIVEDCPKNHRELMGLIGDFLTDGMCYNEEEALKVCANLYKHFKDKNLVNVQNRDTIIAEKLSAPVMISQLAEEGHTGVVKEDDFYDPLLAGERASDGNFNKNEDRSAWKAKKDIKHLKKMQEEKDALDKKIDEFMATKKKVPPPRVIHDKSDSSKADIYLP